MSRRCQHPHVYTYMDIFMNTWVSYRLTVVQYWVAMSSPSSWICSWNK